METSEETLEERVNQLNTAKNKVVNRDYLTLDEVKLLAPSVGTTKPLDGLSKHYVHVPTTTVIEDIQKLGWKPVGVQEVKARKRKGYQKHLITFEHPYYKKEGEGGTEHPQLLLMNSHDGTSKFQLEAGIFRMICSNGMVIKSDDMGSVSIHHMGYDFSVIKEAVESLMNNVPQILNTITKMKETELEKEQMIEFAKKAARLRFDKLNERTKIEDVVDIDELLGAERKEDKGEKLWEVFNRVQEKIINGSFQYKFGEKERKARPIKNFKQNVQVNQDLWALADELVAA